MSKIKLNLESLEKILPGNMEELTQYISKNDLITLINSKLNKDHILINTQISFQDNREILFDGTYRIFTFYIELYSDLTKIYSIKTGKVKENIINPYVFRIAIYNANSYIQEPYYFYINKEHIRNYYIKDIEA